MASCAPPAQGSPCPFARRPDKCNLKSSYQTFSLEPPSNHTPLVSGASLMAILIFSSRDAGCTCTFSLRPDHHGCDPHRRRSLHELCGEAFGPNREVPKRMPHLQVTTFCRTCRCRICWRTFLRASQFCPSSSQSSFPRGSVAIPRTWTLMVKRSRMLWTLP